MIAGVCDTAGGKLDKRGRRVLASAALWGEADLSRQRRHFAVGPSQTFGVLGRRRVLTLNRRLNVANGDAFGKCLRPTAQSRGPVIALHGLAMPAQRLAPLPNKTMRASGARVKLPPNAG